MWLTMIIYVFVSKHINKISDYTEIYFKLIVLRVKQITKLLVLKLTVHNSKKIGKEKKKKRNVVKVPYLPTKVKARNFLINISYRRIKKQDFLNFHLFWIFLSTLLKISTHSF